MVLTPKSLLRHRLAVSQLEELRKVNFNILIPEIDAIKPEKVYQV